ncbi:glutamate synthase subunit beta [Glycomyces algeriensis]|jgi:glutamate synthase (NADPH) small chain|uniref:Dihydropyrimidine dehydrogenase subunit A n=1 Tax=Glycomyces algeriensis TaxID=256037 RepID=A0A9W6G7U9_9ACTN|nr:glutamate synthase subunit beta [Glycomyces algeriensis]MDA1364838.1 glutamate synthase subunit beta [Glycomyces algeriensis]MDR7350103.1 glutamate synthase (NADPH/NADH) small chain [Glycomyces algeriensis]GLI42815.1 dihydropyrimidine dehydrogenase subunit A [Glycomyces algeriensis]
MPDPSGFLEHGRAVPKKRPVPVRILDNREVYTRTSKELVTAQASRCMDCGIPFCHNGCPLGNRIPEWNDLARTGRWGAAIEQLHATNNFPEFTGRLCPAPCEAACVLGIGDDPVTIKNIEVEIIDRAFDDANVRPEPAEASSGKSVAVVGSGPAGLAAAQQLARAGHAVTVYERDDAPGGLLRYGIPDFKLEKHQIDRRVEQMRAEGVEFACNVNVGVDITAEDLRERHDAVILAVGALEGRETEQPGRELAGIHQAMEHLVGANQVVAGKAPFAPIDAKGKHVVIIGGGDTGADCLGVAHRQGAASVRQLDLYPTPPDLRDAGRDPWPTWPVIVRNYPAHEEGGERNYASAAAEFIGDEHGHVRQMRFSEVRVDKSQGRRDILPVEGTEQIVPADLVLLAIGFAGTEDQPLLRQFGIERSRRNVIDCGDDWQTDAPGVFVAGDAHRGASLIVWAIAEGRAAAAAAHKFLGGQTALPAPVESNAQALAA